MNEGKRISTRIISILTHNANCILSFYLKRKLTITNDSYKVQAKSTQFISKDLKIACRILILMLLISHISLISATYIFRCSQYLQDTCQIITRFRFKYVAKRGHSTREISLFAFYKAICVKCIVAHFTDIPVYSLIK